MDSYKAKYETGPVAASIPPEDLLPLQSLCPPPPPPLYSSLVPRNANVLDKPVVIPRMDVAGRLAVPFPFQRAYSPALGAHGIDDKQFVAFIDDLAVVQAPSPPLQALSVVGMGIGMVPHHWAMAASAGIGLAAGVGTAAVSAARTKKFIEHMNQEVFAPRGLKMSIKKDTQLGGDLRIPITADLLAPAYWNGQYRNLRDRRMFMLAPYISQLTTDVPPPNEMQKNFLDKISAKQIQRRMNKEEKKRVEKERKAMEEAAKEEAKEAKKQSKREKKSRRRGSDADITYDGEHHGENRESFRKHERRSQEVSEKDRKKLAKMEYVVIESL